MDLKARVIETVFNCYEVQRKISANLNLQDLKSLRLVNKLWQHASIPSLKEKCQVTLDSPLSFQNFINFLNEQKEMEGSIAYMHFSNFRIILMPAKFSSLQQAYLTFTQFWGICNRASVNELSFQFPWTLCYPILAQIYYPDNSTSGGELALKRLSLSIEDNNVAEEQERNPWGTGELSDATFTDLADSPLNLNPQLSTLNLNTSIVLNNEKKVFPFSWTQFLQSCPNICHLSIHSDYASVQFCRIVNALAERQKVLKTLKIGTRDQRLFSDEFLKKLVYLTGNHTRTLSLGFLPSIKHNSPLDFMLRQASSSLSHLTFLQCRTSNQGTVLSFTATDTTFCSCFPSLTTLRISKELVPNLAFLVKMPALKRLEIYRDSTIGQHDNLSNPVIRTRSLPVVMEHLQSLVLEPFIPVEHIWKLTNWFPNLKRLQMKANDLIARVIFIKWTALKELYLIGEVVLDNNDIVRSSLTDEGITGMTKEELQQGNCQVRRMAYIGNLRNLEICKLQVVPDYMTGLTDYSIEYGLADVATLKSVCLVKTLVSPVAADTLRQRGVNVIIARE